MKEDLQIYYSAPKGGKHKLEKALTELLSEYGYVIYSSSMNVLKKRRNLSFDLKLERDE